MHAVLREALGVLWPRECAGCGAPDEGVCRACAALLAGAHADRLAGVPLRWAAPYDGVARRVVLAAKEDGRPSATRACARALARLVDDVRRGEDAPVLAVLVPPSREGLRRRGFAPVRVLAGRAGLAWVELEQRESRQQKRRGRAERLARGGLAVRRRDAARIAGARVVIVDDVVTTGATMRAAIAACRAAGAQVVAAVAITRVPRHG